MNILCWLLGHKEGKWELDYNMETHQISFHCIRCQTRTRIVKDEALLTDEEYTGFAEIFKDREG